MTSSVIVTTTNASARKRARAKVRSTNGAMMPAIQIGASSGSITKTWCNRNAAGLVAMFLAFVAASSSRNGQWFAACQSTDGTAMTNARPMPSQSWGHASSRRSRVSSAPTPSAISHERPAYFASRPMPATIPAQIGARRSLRIAARERPYATAVQTSGSNTVVFIVAGMPRKNGAIAAAMPAAQAAPSPPPSTRAKRTVSQTSAAAASTAGIRTTHT
ncbi:MAG TPA: hypothetical protein VMD91_02400 [Candidatus Sulfotelmatobacter sp.]|nr:hypothetical protein [Candidatus Sulfotelmatobacter sp.]